MIAVLLLGIPLLFFLAILLMPAMSSGRVALAGAVCSAVVSIVAYVQFLQGNFSYLSENIPWVQSLGIQFNIGIDGISMVLVLLTGLAVSIHCGCRFQIISQKSKAFYALMMLMQLGLFGVFMARDAFLFYVFYELTLVPVYFICAIWGGERSIQSRLSFLSIHWQAACSC
jgi:NADH-quinone oxidoreductase subunit M